jgi:hypothetical protein
MSCDAGSAYVQMRRAVVDGQFSRTHAWNRTRHSPSAPARPGPTISTSPWHGAHPVEAAPGSLSPLERSSAIRPTMQLDRPVRPGGSVHRPHAATRSISGIPERLKHTSSISGPAR